MKKVIFALVVLVTCYSLRAQQPAIFSTQTSISGTYSAPEPILISFRTVNPTVTTATWEPMNGWWRATYKDNNNRIVKVYYSTEPWHLERGTNFSVALPVMNTYIPEAVITAAINSYGSNIYSITKMKSGNNTDGYMVTLIENGTSRIVWMNGENVAFNDVNK